VNGSSLHFFARFVVIPVYLLSGCWSKNEHVLSVDKPKEFKCVETVLRAELRDPPTLVAQDKTIKGKTINMIDTQLSAKLTEKCIRGVPVKAKLMSYIDMKAGTDIDMRPVGPAYILYMKPKLKNGPRLKIKFTNRLGKENVQYNCDHHSQDVKLCTNLHTHGFHVSPRGSDNLEQVQSDNVFLTIPPYSKTVPYQFDLPKNHAPGTHWLHAHLHGSTAPQVKNGMAGALILKGALDKKLEKMGISGNKDKIMILQQLSLEDGEPLCGEVNGINIVTSINGQCLPKITVTAGDVHRWRFIHAGVSATVNLAVIDLDEDKYVAKNFKVNPILKVDLHEFARDGITMNGTQVQKNIELQPGYRSDVLLQFPECKNNKDSCQLLLIDDQSDPARSLHGKAEKGNPIAIISILKKSAAPMKLPDPEKTFKNPYKFVCNPNQFKRCSENLAVEKVWFANINNPSGGPTLKTVNGKVYPATDEKILKLGHSNTWKLWVGADQASSASHPFHIHVNPFQVFDKKNKFSYWKDTLLVSGTDNKGENNALTVVTRYDNFAGKFVLHCHNLNHEDEGMMMNVKILCRQYSTNAQLQSDECRY